jgi:hypothetical protein
MTSIDFNKIGFIAKENEADGKISATYQKKQQEAEKHTNRICPNPTPWYEAFDRLTSYAQLHPCTPPSPPRPLILAGANK